MSNQLVSRWTPGSAQPATASTHLGLELRELRRRLWKVLEEGVHGLCFSAYLRGDSPDEGTQLTEAQIRGRMEIIAPHCEWIRTFSCTDGNELSPRVAHELGLKTLVGAWVGDDREKNQVEMEALLEIVRAGHADQVAVGNEVLLRGDLSEDELIAQIEAVKSACPGVPVGYVDAYYLFEEHPRLVDACDVLYVNCYPFWEKFSLEASVGLMRQMVARAQAVAKGKPVVISETGWPTSGAPVGAAVPSPENAAIYALEAFEWTQAQGIPLFYFSAFDEAWKTGPEGDCGDSWGFWDQDGRRKDGA